MKFKKILLIPWLLCLPIAAGIQNINKESNFKNDNTQVLNDGVKNDPYLNLNITYGNDTLHSEKPTISAIDVDYNNLININKIQITGGIIQSPLNPQNPNQLKDEDNEYINNPDDQRVLIIGEKLDIEIDKESTWATYFSEINQYNFNHSGVDTYVDPNGSDTNMYTKENGYPMMFDTDIVFEEESNILEDLNYLYLYAVAPAVDLWYAPTIEDIVITGTKDSNESVELGKITFEDVTLKEGPKIIWWTVTALIIVGIIIFVSWIIYKKRNKYLI